MRRCTFDPEDGATPSFILPYKSLRPGARKRGPGGGGEARFPRKPKSKWIQRRD
jgi:hypothetical protein